MGSNRLFKTKKAGNSKARRHLNFHSSIIFTYVESHTAVPDLLQPIFSYRYFPPLVFPTVLLPPVSPSSLSNPIFPPSGACPPRYLLQQFFFSGFSHTTFYRLGPLTPRYIPSRSLSPRSFLVQDIYIMAYRFLNSKDCIL